MKHTGGCHCGKVKYEVDMELKNAISCNCSICMKRGSLLDFVQESKFKLLSGQDSLTDYQFNKHMIHHMFCKSCGILSFANGQTPDGSKMVAVNLRCLDGFDPAQVHIQNIDGRSR